MKEGGSAKGRAVTTAQGRWNAGVLPLRGGPAGGPRARISPQLLRSCKPLNRDSSAALCEAGEASTNALPTSGQQSAPQADSSLFLNEFKFKIQYKVREKELHIW